MSILKIEEDQFQIQMKFIQSKPITLADIKLAREIKYGPDPQ